MLHVPRGAGLQGSNVKSRRAFLPIAAAIFVSTLGADAPKADEVPPKLSPQAVREIAQLEAEIEAYRQKAERAEHWLHTVYKEIEDRFLKQEAPRRARR